MHVDTNEYFSLIFFFNSLARQWMGTGSRDFIIYQSAATCARVCNAKFNFTVLSNHPFSFYISFAFAVINLHILYSPTGNALIPLNHTRRDHFTFHACFTARGGKKEIAFIWKIRCNGGE